MNLLVLKYNKFFDFFDNVKSEYLGFYISFIFHLSILLFAIGLPNFFEPKQVILPTIIPIEILNVSEETSIPTELPKDKPQEIKKIKTTETKKTIEKEKKFNSSDNQEIKKIQVKEKLKIETNKTEKEIIAKDSAVIKEKKPIPTELEKEKIEISTNDSESLPTKKIKPRIKPKPKPKLIEDTLKSDVLTKPKPQPKPEREINIASMLKDLRNEKTTPKPIDDEKEAKKEIIKKNNENDTNESPQLSISEIDLVLQQLSQCFIAPAGAEIQKSMFVRIEAKIQRNRKVLENSIRIIDTNISKSNPVYGPITESAMRTLLNPDCIPLKLPEEKYNLWKNLTMKFDYSIMRGN